MTTPRNHAPHPTLVYTASGAVAPLCGNSGFCAVRLDEPVTCVHCLDRLDERYETAAYGVTTLRDVRACLRLARRLMNAASRAGDVTHDDWLRETQRVWDEAQT